MSEQSLGLFLNAFGQYCDLETIRTVFDVGARDCAETAEFHRRLPDAVIYAFECNPTTLPSCRATVADLERAHLVEKAVSDRDGITAFYAIDPDRTKTTWADGNPGASSLLLASDTYPVETYVQREIQVEAVRLDSFLAQSHIDSVDLLWMDIQGAELLALRGLGDRIQTVKAIHLEVEFMEIYKAQPLFGDIRAYLAQHGFIFERFTTTGMYSADAFFINTALLSAAATAHARARGKLRIGAAALRRRTHEAYASHRALRWVIDVPRQTQQQPLTALRRMSWLFWTAYGRRMFGLDVNMSRNIPSSDLRLDIVIPASESDLDVLPFTVDSLRRNLKHPVGDIYVIAPSSPRIEELCHRLGAIYENEASVTRLSKDDFAYVVDGVDRSGWFYQQLIKLSADEIAETEHFLVADADTLLVKPQVFEHAGRIIFNQSDEYHVPYFDVYERLLGERPRSPLSFISHQMVLTKTTLRALKEAVEAQRGKAWDQAIVDAVSFSEPSNFSEYEVYGNFCLESGISITRSYWFNQVLPRHELDRLDIASFEQRRLYKSLSFHNSL